MNIKTAVLSDAPVDVYNIDCNLDTDLSIASRYTALVTLALCVCDGYVRSISSSNDTTPPVDQLLSTVVAFVTLI